VAGAPLASLPVFDTPAGRLGVLVCADSWHPAAYTQLKAQAVDLVAVPSASLSRGLWAQPWGGYNGAAAPPDVDLRDVGVLTEGQAWRKYALAGRLAASGSAFGINVFLRGAFWDTGTDGHSLAVAAGTVVETQQDEAALLNVWL
jgi:predicted amidohydrolase